MAGPIVNRTDLQGGIKLRKTQQYVKFIKLSKATCFDPTKGSSSGEIIKVVIVHKYIVHNGTANLKFSTDLHYRPLRLKLRA
jgi:hypothetical protein